MFSSIKFENTEKSEEKKLSTISLPRDTLLNVFLYLLLVLVLLWVCMCLCVRSNRIEIIVIIQ